MNASVDAYIRTLNKWQQEIGLLRSIILDCGLTETLKWGQPCYTFNSSNVVLLGTFEEHCVISFLKGALLKDADKILSKPGENTQAARIIRFTDAQQVAKMAPLLTAYIQEAIAVEKAGKRVKLKKQTDEDIPTELKNIFTKTPSLKNAFYLLTPGRQRAYTMYFAAPKQSKTRLARIEKCTQRIMQGKGLMDCVCGLSKKMPSCDGSHKYIAK